MDPIANFLTIIRNGYLARKAEVVIPHSNLKESLSKLLVEHGYLVSSVTNGEKASKVIRLELAYSDDQPLLTHIERISKPSLRRYVAADKIPVALSGKGLVILSTSKGLMTGHDAKKKNLGGELICRLW